MVDFNIQKHVSVYIYIHIYIYQIMFGAYGFGGFVVTDAWEYVHVRVRAYKGNTACRETGAAALSAKRWRTLGS